MQWLHFYFSRDSVQNLEHDKIPNRTKFTMDKILITKYAMFVKIRLPEWPFDQKPKITKYNIFVMLQTDLLQLFIIFFLI